MGEEMKTFRFLAEVVIKTENEDDARMELINLMDEHNIYWELEDE